MTLGITVLTCESWGIQTVVKPFQEMKGCHGLIGPIFVCLFFSSTSGLSLFSVDVVDLEIAGCGQGCIYPIDQLRDGIRMKDRAVEAWKGQLC